MQCFWREIRKAPFSTGPPLRALSSQGSVRRALSSHGALYGPGGGRSEREMARGPAISQEMMARSKARGMATGQGGLPSEAEVLVLITV